MSSSSLVSSPLAGGWRPRFFGVSGAFFGVIFGGIVLASFGRVPFPGRRIKLRDPLAPARAASLPTVRKAGGELTDEARMAIVVDYEAFSQGVRTKFSSVKALALAHKVSPGYPAKLHKRWSKSGTVSYAYGP